MKNTQCHMTRQIVDLQHVNAYEKESLKTFYGYMRDYQERLLASRHAHDKEDSRRYLKACRKQRRSIQEALARIKEREAKIRYLLDVMSSFRRPDFSTLDHWWEIWHEAVHRLRHYQCELLGYRCLSPRPCANVAQALSSCKEARKQLKHARTVIVALTPRHTMGSATR